MKIFSKRTNPQVQSHAQLTERQARLTGMRSEAQAALDAALGDRQSHLIGGNVDNDDVAKTLQARADSAQSALVGLDDAITALAIQITNAEAAQCAEQLRIKSEADAKELSAVLANVEKVLPAWIATAREMSELLGMCDRIYVMNEGRLVVELDRNEASQERIMRAIVNAGHA